jgi:hypothetical protein
MDKRGYLSDLHHLSQDRTLPSTVFDRAGTSNACGRTMYGSHLTRGCTSPQSTYRYNCNTVHSAASRTATVDLVVLSLSSDMGNLFFVDRVTVSLRNTFGRYGPRGVQPTETGHQCTWIIREAFISASSRPSALAQRLLPPSMQLSTPSNAAPRVLVIFPET